jgi:hypothetical protein
VSRVAISPRDKGSLEGTVGPRAGGRESVTTEATVLVNERPHAIVGRLQFSRDQLARTRARALLKFLPVGVGHVYAGTVRS